MWLCKFSIYQTSKFWCCLRVEIQLSWFRSNWTLFLIKLRVISIYLQYNNNNNCDIGYWLLSRFNEFSWQWRNDWSKGRFSFSSKRCWVLHGSSSFYSYNRKFNFFKITSCVAALFILLYRCSFYCIVFLIQKLPSIFSFEMQCIVLVNICPVVWICCHSWQHYNSGKIYSILFCISCNFIIYDCLLRRNLVVEKWNVFNCVNFAIVSTIKRNVTVPKWTISKNKCRCMTYCQCILLT